MCKFNKVIENCWKRYGMWQCNKGKYYAIHGGITIQYNKYSIKVNSLPVKDSEHSVKANWGNEGWQCLHGGISS